MQQASCLEGGPLLWIGPLYLHVNQKSDDDDDDENIFCYPSSELSRQEGSNEGSQHVFIENKKNYL